MSEPERHVAPTSAEGGYEYRVLTIPRAVSRSEARRLLTDHAEYGHWELARVQLFMGGMRKITLRRRIMRIHRPA